MTRELLARINSACLMVCIASIVMAVLVGLLGIWRVLGPEDQTLWRALATCGTFFFAAVLASLALRCFRTNE